eukprot:TRINITY_DN4757_c0_g1_i1.p1 TRINITY_DN4757_c0_g1~~TRINITY_DN4757_c0_g1_i1.p1  ORF type:complete len:321 (-),score=41.45 TRINITY_DN4757_c0_g1_i1:489-1451(-)
MLSICMLLSIVGLVLLPAVAALHVLAPGAPARPFELRFELDDSLSKRSVRTEYDEWFSVSASVSGVSGRETPIGLNDVRVARSKRAEGCNSYWMNPAQSSPNQDATDDGETAESALGSASDSHASSPGDGAAMDADAVSCASSLTLSSLSTAIAGAVWLADAAAAASVAQLTVRLPDHLHRDINRSTVYVNDVPCRATTTAVFLCDDADQHTRKRQSAECAFENDLAKALATLPKTFDFDPPTLVFNCPSLPYLLFQLSTMANFVDVIVRLSETLCVPINLLRSAKASGRATAIRLISRSDRPAQLNSGRSRHSRSSWTS